MSPITHWEDATACFERTLVALLCLHGEYHEVVQPMLNFAHWLQTQRQRFTRKTREDRCLPADLVQRVNLDLGLWLDSVEEEDGPLMFPSWDMLQVTLAGNNMLVNQRPTPPQLGRRANFSGMAALGGRPPPQAPTPPPPPPPPVNPRGPSVGVPNNDKDPDLIIPIGVGLRHCVQACRNANPNVRNDGLPLSDASLPMCLSFHFVGRCHSNCGNALHSHRPPSPTEKNGLLSFRTIYCVPRFPAPAPHDGGGGSGGGGGGYKGGGGGGGYNGGGGGYNGGGGL